MHAVLIDSLGTFETCNWAMLGALLSENKQRVSMPVLAKTYRFVHE